MNGLLRSAIFITFVSISLGAESNVTTETNTTATNTEQNATTAKADKAQKQLEEQMKKEQKFAKEQRFYQGDEYDLSAHEVDLSTLDSIPLIEPDYDFNMDDVYD
jgi:hypothetical protein